MVSRGSFGETRGARKVPLLLHSLFAIEFAVLVALARIAAERLDAAEFLSRSRFQGTVRHERYTGPVWTALLVSAANHEKAAKRQREQCVHRGSIAALPGPAQAQ